jgi:hypothetical protein
MKPPPLVVFIVSRNKHSQQKLSQAPVPGGVAAELYLKPRETGIPYIDTFVCRLQMTQTS